MRDTIGMSITGVQTKSEGLSPFIFVAVSVSAAFLGSAGALAFGFAGAVIAAAVAAAGAFFIARPRRTPAQAEPAAAAAAAAVESGNIPPDRIDPLTGLANENGLLAWFSEKAARLAADGMGIVVLAAKLDGFDSIVAAKGQATADAVLKEIANRVAVVAGSDGIAARTKGEEFASVVAVVPSRSAAVAEERAGHLVELICRPVEQPTGVVWVGGSVGGAAGSPADGPATLERARAALAQAARSGRGKFVVYKG